MTPQDDKPKQARELDVTGAKQILDEYKMPSENIDIGSVYYAATQLRAAYDSLYSRFNQQVYECDKTAQERDRAEKERDDILERYRAIELANKEMSRNDHVHFGSLLQERDQARAEAERLNIQAGIYSLEADKWKALAEKMAVALTDGYRDGFNFVIEEINAILAEFEAAKK